MAKTMKARAKVGGRGTKGKKKATGKKPTASFSRKVKKVITSFAEHKHKTWDLMNGYLIDAGIDFTDITPLPIMLVQGDASYQRDGNRVRPVKCYIKGRLTFTQGLVTASITADLFVLNHRQIKSFTGIIANAGGIANTLLDNGQGSDVPYDGTMMTSQLLTNTDDQTVISRRQVTLNQDDFRFLDGKSYYDFVIPVPIPAVLIYDDTNNYPSNFAPYMAIGWHYANGLPPPGEGGQILQCFSHLYMTWTDV